MNLATAAPMANRWKKILKKKRKKRKQEARCPGLHNRPWAAAVVVVARPSRRPRGRLPKRPLPRRRQRRRARRKRQPRKNPRRKKLRKRRPAKRKPKRLERSPHADGVKTACAGSSRSQSLRLDYSLR